MHLCICIYVFPGHARLVFSKSLYCCCVVWARARKRWSFYRALARNCLRHIMNLYGVGRVEPLHRSLVEVDGQRCSFDRVFKDTQTINDNGGQHNGLASTNATPRPHLKHFLVKTMDSHPCCYRPSILVKLRRFRACGIPWG